MPPPSASVISVAQVLRLLETQFAAVAAALERRGFALWVGSGISLGRAPSVGGMLARALEHLRERVDRGNSNCKYRTALMEALQMAGLDGAARAAIDLHRPFGTWAQKAEIVTGLWNRYSEFLDIRIPGEPDDYMLWTAVDVRGTYGRLDDPDVEHLCIAILVIEGAIAEIASANWDGLIEAAVNRLNGDARPVQVVVDPAHLRDAPARTRLIKFHGCAIHCVQDPAIYRPFLIATRPQITFWPHNPRLIALRAELTGVATNSRTLMIGLSLQDTNLQDLFAAARAALPWPWPSAPQAQGHIFCEDALGSHQINMLRVVYGAAYGQNREDIEASALLRAYGKQALLGFVLHLLCEKLVWLAATICADGPLAASVGDFATALRELRDRVAVADLGDHLTFVNNFIRQWSRAMMLFRRGELAAPGHRRYEPIAPFSLQELPADPNVLHSGLPELAVALALLRRGEAAGKWNLSLPTAEDIQNGALQAIGTWPGAKPAQVYFVSGAASAIRLIESGAGAAENLVIVHSDDAWKRIAHAEFGGRRGTRRRHGRSGRPPVRHVSITELLQLAPNFAALEERFAEEVTL